MKHLISLAACILLFGCAVMPTSEISNVTTANHAGKNTDVFLKEMNDKGLFCQRLPKLESDQRLKTVTDGTLNDVQFHECMAESDGFFCIARAGTFIISQYNKVLRLNGLNTSKVCLWD